MSAVNRVVENLLVAMCDIDFDQLALSVFARFQPLMASFIFSVGSILFVFFPELKLSLGLYSKKGDM